MSKKPSNPKALTLKELIPVMIAKKTVQGTIIVAFIGLLGILIPLLMGYPKEPVEKETEYVGRVIDKDNQNPIANAKITLDLQNDSLIVYTDNEGKYRFKIKIQSEISGQVRVDAQGYSIYTRNISISPDSKIIEDIRLQSQGSSIEPQPTSSLQIGVWNTDYYSNTQLNPPVSYHISQPAEQNTEGGYTIQLNSFELTASDLQIPQNNFSVRMSGVFYFESAYYEFHCEHHDGCRIYIDGKIGVDAWWDGGGGHDVGRDIIEGNHVVSIEFYDKSGLGMLQIIWRRKA